MQVAYTVVITSKTFRYSTSGNSFHSNVLINLYIVIWLLWFSSHLGDGFQSWSQLLGQHPFGTSHFSQLDYNQHQQTALRLPVNKYAGSARWILVATSSCCAQVSTRSACGPRSITKFSVKVHSSISYNKLHFTNHFSNLCLQGDM